MAVVYLNGEFMDEDKARVPVFDRGFIFGDGVYEVIPVFGDHVLRLDEHLLRLQDSLDSTYIPNPMNAERWRGLVHDLLQRNPGAENRSVYLQVTRGVGPREHVSHTGLVPTVFGMCNPISDRVYDQGVSVVSHEDIRWQYCHIKAISLLPGILLREKAKRIDGSTEVILVRDGLVTEGAASNVFIVHGGCIRTPPHSNHLLPGVTRDLLVELLRAEGMECREEPVSGADLRAAGEIWITGSTIGVAPVIRLDGRPVGTGRPGDCWRRADILYQDFKKAPRPLRAGNAL